jgi:hypothetical protein
LPKLLLKGTKNEAQFLKVTPILYGFLLPAIPCRIALYTQKAEARVACCILHWRVQRGTWLNIYGDLFCA